MANIFIGINIDSDSTTIYKMNSGIVLKEPSLIALSNDLRDKHIIAVGESAKNLFESGNKNISVLSPISSGVIKFEEPAIAMLSNYIRKCVPEKNFLTKIKAIVLIPISISQNEKQTIESVCQNSGISEISIIPEVISFALANNINIITKKPKMFVKIGYDTTEISIIKNYGIERGISISIGKSMISVALSKLIEDKNIKISKTKAEEINSEICSLFENYNAEMLVKGIDIKNNKPISVMLKSSDFYCITNYYYKKIAETIKSILLELDSELISEILNCGIYFYGVGCNIPGFEYFMNKNLGIKINNDYFNDTIYGIERLIKSPGLVKKIK